MRAMDNTPYEQKDLLSAEDVARYFGVGQITVYRWCKEGRLQCIKLGKHWRIRREALEDFLSQHEERSTTLAGLLSSFYTGARQCAGDCSEHRHSAPPRRGLLPCWRFTGWVVGEVLRWRREVRGGASRPVREKRPGSRAPGARGAFPYESRGRPFGRTRYCAEATYRRGNRRGAHGVGLLRLGQAGRLEYGPEAAREIDRASGLRPAGRKDGHARRGD